ELSMEVVSLSGRPTQEDLDKIGRKFFPNTYGNSIVETAREAIASELEEIATVLRSERTHLEKYGRILDQTAEGLNNRSLITRELLQKIVGVMAVATNSTIDHGKQVATTLSDKSSELESVKSKLEEYKRLADTDPLTQIWNRRAFDKDLIGLDEARRIDAEDGLPAVGGVVVAVRRLGRPVEHRARRRRHSLTEQAVAEHELGLLHDAVQVKRDAAPRRDVEPIDPGVARLVDDVDGAERLLLLPELDPGAVALDLQRRDAGAGQGSGLGQPEAHPHDLGPPLPRRRRGQEDARQHVGGALQQLEPAAAQKERNLRRGAGVVDGGAEPLAHRGRLGIELQLDVDAQSLRGVPLMRVQANDAVDLDALDENDI
ncbi:MAG TPA: hypothetical protein PLW65_28695, partial [Pseudomonadota bacterium]|nr:hypothetical protein [Pseudomonadota bacterium]